MKSSRLALLLLPVLLAPMANAAPPAPTSVPFSSSSTLVSSQSFGSTTLYTLSTGVFIGPPVIIVDSASGAASSSGFVGNCYGTTQQLVESNGKTQFSTTCTYTGTVPGAPTVGTAEFQLVGIGSIPGSFQGLLAIGKGTAGLAGIHATGTFDGTFSPIPGGIITPYVTITSTGSLTAYIQFAPSQTTG